MVKSDEVPSVNDRHERLLTWGLAVLLVVSLVGIVYFSATPQQRTDPYTEFYVLGPDGNASDYPKELSVGESGSVIVGISNQEHHSMQYTLVLQIDSETKDSQTVSVENGETWEQEHSFTPESPGQKQLRILLYRGDDISTDSEPYRSLRLSITVQE